MRFAHVNHRYYPFVGGSERYMQELSERLAYRGHRVTVTTTNAYDLEFFWDPSFRAVDAPSRECLNRVDVRRLPVRHVPLNHLLFGAGRRGMGELSRALHQPAVYRSMSSFLPRVPGLRGELIRTGPHDVIHASNLGLESPALQAAAVARRFSSAFVITPFIHLGREGDRVARRYVSMPHQVELLRGADLVLTMTDMEAEFVRSFGVRPDLVVPVGVGIDPEEVTGGDGRRFREKHGIGGFLVASIGALAPDKGTPDLVRAVSRLRRDGHDVELVLAGPALSGFESWFSREDSSTHDGIHMLGYIDPEEKRDLLDAIDVLALPSRTESFGIVYLEAWANRKPVIAAGAGAVTELVHDGLNGCLVPFGDDDAIVSRIRDLAASRALRDSLGIAGESLALSRYTWESVLNRIASAHETVLGFTV